MIKSRSTALLTMTVGVIAGGAVYFLCDLPRASSGSGAQESLTFLLFMTSLFLPFSCCFYRSQVSAIGAYDFFQPGTTVALLYYFYLVIPGFNIWYNLGYHANWISAVNNPELVNYAFLVGIVGVVFFGLGYKNNVRLRSIAGTKGTCWNPKIYLYSKPATTIIIILFVFGFVSKINHFFRVGGTSYDILLQLSPAARAESDIIFNGIEVLTETFFDWGILFLLFKYALENKNKYVVALSVAAVSFNFFFGAKRSYITPFILYPLIWYHYFTRSISFRRGIIYTFAGVALMGSLIFVRILAPLATRGGTNSAVVMDTITQDSLGFYLNSAEFASFEMIMYAIEDRDMILKSIGGLLRGGIEYNFLTLSYFIPRAIWPSKPIYTDISQIFYRKAVGDRLDIGFAVTIFGTLYLFGHIIGVALGMLIIGVIFKNIYSLFLSRKDDPFVVFFYPIIFWMAFQFLRFGTLGFTLLFFFQTQMVGIIIMLFLRGKSGLGVIRGTLN